MIFNGIEKEYLTILRGRNRPAWAPVERELISVVGQSGAHLSHNKRQVRTLEVPIFLMADSFSDLQKLKEDLAEWLIHDEPKKLIFKDEPDRVYYALVSGDLNLEELIRWGSGTITFICPDPFKYSSEETITGTDNLAIHNDGTADAEPIFELTATKKTTFAMVSDGTEYNVIGKIADDDVEIVDEKVKVYGLTGIDGWSSEGTQPYARFPKIDGTMVYDETGLRPDGYGTGDKIHGPAVMRELNETIDDFEMNAIFDIISERKEDNFRMEIGLLDENFNQLAMIGINDNSKYKNERNGLARMGEYRGAGQGYVITESDYSHEWKSEATNMHLSIVRENGVYSFKIGRWMSGRLINIINRKYVDVENEYSGKLKYVQVMIGSFGDRRIPFRVRVNRLDIYKLTKLTVDQTPYILDVGDVVTFDHKDEEILINGEPRMDLKNFGGSFFSLPKGQSTILVSPEDSFDTVLKYREKYL